MYKRSMAEANPQKLFLTLSFAPLVSGMIVVIVLLTIPSSFANSLVSKNILGTTIRFVTSCCSYESQRQIHALEEFLAIDQEYKAEFFESRESNQRSVIVTTSAGDRSMFLPVTRTNFILRVDHLR